MHISKENYKYTITMKDFKTPFSQLARIDSQKSFIMLYTLNL